MRHPISQSKKEETKKTQGRRRRHHQMVGVCVCIFEQKKKQRQCHVLFILHEVFRDTSIYPHPEHAVCLSCCVCMHACIGPVPFSPVQLSPGQRYEKKNHSNDGDSTTITTRQRNSSFFFFSRKPPRSGRTFYIQQLLGLFIMLL